jgi:hypothetical protein
MTGFTGFNRIYRMKTQASKVSDLVNPEKSCSSCPRFVSDTSSEVASSDKCKTMTGLTG